MTTTDANGTLPLADSPAGGGGCGCGGCGCASGPDAATTAADPAIDTATTQEEDMMTTSTYAVTGMTCGHCVNAVTDELKTLDGVTDVTVDLVAGGTSSVAVASTQRLDQAQVAAALDEAGDYQLV